MAKKKLFSFFARLLPSQNFVFYFISFFQHQVSYKKFAAKRFGFTLVENVFERFSSYLPFGLTGMLIGCWKSGSRFHWLLLLGLSHWGLLLLLLFQLGWLLFGSPLFGTFQLGWLLFGRFWLGTDQLGTLLSQLLLPPQFARFGKSQ